jgi:hypothetical protein
MNRYYPPSSPPNKEAPRLNHAQHTVLLWTILSLMLLCLVSCASAINTSNTSGTPTPQPTVITQSDQNMQTPTLAAQATPTLSAAQATAQEKAIQANSDPTRSSAQQYQKTLQLNGKTITVTVTTRVWLAFYQPRYPKQNIQISCQPSQAIDNHSLENASLPPPYYLVGYQAVEPGTCTIKNGNYILTVKVTALQ